jgi:haloalkane dehalogenase
MVPVLTDAGLRCVAPDLVGFGRSDKPAAREDYTYARHVEWMRQALFDELDLRDVTLVGQDWGGLLGLRLVAEHPDRFARVVAANTGLPTGDQDMPEVWWRFRRAVENADDLDIGRLVQAGCLEPMSEQVRAAYDAPFPDESYPATGANRAAWSFLTRWEKPFLVAFSDGDPITGGMAPVLRRAVPGAEGLDHPVLEGAGHFLQEDAGVRLGEVVAAFVRKT